MISSREFYLQYADLVEGWKKLNPNDVANMYLDTDNEMLKDRYFAILMLDYWGYGNTLFHRWKATLKLTLDEAQSIVSDAILKALREHKWRVETSSIYNDPKGPEKAISMCINYYLGDLRQKANFDCKKINYISYSLDDICAKYNKDDKEMQYLDFVVDERTLKNNSYKAQSLAQTFINNNNLKMAIIIDNIAFNDSSRYSMASIFRNITDLDSKKYTKYFLNTYKNANKEDIQNAVETISKWSLSNLRKQIDRLKVIITNDKELKELI